VIVEKNILGSVSERLKRLRKTLNLSRSFLSKKYGLSPDTLKSWENNQSNITKKGLEKCIDIYGNEGLLVSQEWLLTGKGLEPKTLLNINQYLKQQESGLEQESINDEILLIQEADFFKSLSKNSVVIMVTNNDMLPFYQPGDYVGGRFNQNKNIESIIGSNCIVKIDSKILIRRLTKNESGGVNLITTNPYYGSLSEPVIYDLEIEPNKIAPILWHRRLSS